MKAMARRSRDPRDAPTAIATVLMLLVVDDDDPVGVVPVGGLEADVLAAELAVWLLIDTDVVEAGDDEDLTHWSGPIQRTGLHVFKNRTRQLRNIRSLTPSATALPLRREW